MPNKPVQAAAEGLPKSRPTDEDIVSAMRMLEGPIHSLLMMSEILGDMLEDDLREFDIKSGENRAMPKPGRSLTVILSAGQIDRISFLWNDVIVRATKLQHAYLKALEGEEVSA